MKALKLVGSSVVDLQKYARQNGFPTLTARHVLYGRNPPLIRSDIWEVFKQHIVDRAKQRVQELKERQPHVEKYTHQDR